jgi:hypothetical protein
MPCSPRLDMTAISRAIDGAREVVRSFGNQPLTTAETSYLLQRHHVQVFLEDLPEKHPAMLSPIAFRGTRALSLGAHVPLLQRRLVMLHESGHLYTGTAEFGVTYDNDDWRSPHEQLADAFAAVALVPTSLVDYELDARIWVRDAEDAIAGHLLGWAEGLWSFARAVYAAQNRLRIRARLAV